MAPKLVRPEKATTVNTCSEGFKERPLIVSYQGVIQVLLLKRFTESQPCYYNNRSVSLPYFKIFTEKPMKM